MGFGTQIEMKDTILHNFLNLNDRETAKCFFGEYAGIIRYAVRSIGIRNNVQTEDDLFMDAVAFILKDDMRVLRLFKGRSKFSTYLYTVSRRYAMSRAAKENMQAEKRVDIALDTFESQLMESFPDVTEEESSLLKKAVAECDSDTQLFIRMLFFDKKSTQEIMRVFGWNSENSVYSKKNKTIEKLKKIFRKNIQAAKQSNEKTPI